MKHNVAGLKNSAARLRKVSDLLAVETCLVMEASRVDYLLRLCGACRDAAGALDATCDLFAEAHELITGYPPVAERPRLTVVGEDEPEPAA